MDKRNKKYWSNRLVELERGSQLDIESLKLATLRAMVKAEEKGQTCSECRCKLSVMKWNRKVDILYCDNSKCGKYHTPVGSVKVGLE